MEVPKSSLRGEGKGCKRRVGDKNKVASVITKHKSCLFSEPVTPKD